MSKLQLSAAPAKLNHIGVDVGTPPLGVLVAAERLRTLNYRNSEILSRPGQDGEQPFHITLCYGFDASKYPAAKQYVESLNLTTDDFKWGNVKSVEPDHLKAKGKAIICVELVSDKIDKARAVLTEQTENKDPGTIANGGKPVPLHVTLMCVKRSDISSSGGGAGGSPKRPDKKEIDDNPGAAKRAKTDDWTKRVIMRHNHHIRTEPVTILEHKSNYVNGKPRAKLDVPCQLQLLFKTVDVFHTHQPCLDGMYCYNLFLKHYTREGLEHVPYRHEDTKAIGQHCENKTLLFMDCCPSLEKIKEIAAWAHRVIVIDHHPGALELAKAELPENVSFVVSQSADFCGASLLWEIIHHGETIERPLSLKVIEKGDTKPIETFTDEERYLSLYIGKASKPANGESEYSRFRFTCEYVDGHADNLKTGIAEGKQIFDAITTSAKKQYDEGRIVKWSVGAWKDMRVIVCEFKDIATVRYMFELAGKDPRVDLLAAVPTDQKAQGKIMLRSTNPQKWDAGKICKHFETAGLGIGGGHAVAAGLTRKIASVAMLFSDVDVA